MASKSGLKVFDCDCCGGEKASKLGCYSHTTELYIERQGA